MQNKTNLKQMKIRATFREKEQFPYGKNLPILEENKME